MGQLRLRKEIAPPKPTQVEARSQIPALQVQRRSFSSNLFKPHQVASGFVVPHYRWNYLETRVQSHLGNVVPFDTEQSKEVQVGSESKQANSLHRA